MIEILQKPVKMPEIFHLFPNKRKNIFTTMQSLNRRLLIQSISRSDFTISTAPSYLILSLSCRCNLRCPHCLTHGSDEAREKIPPDMNFKNCLPHIRRGLPFLKEYSLTMSGEPLLIRNFQHIVEQFSKFGIKLNLVTNGTLISEKNVEVIANNSSDICFSIDGAKPETVEKLRRGAKFTPLMHNIKYLVEIVRKMDPAQQPRITINFTVMGSNIAEMPEIIKLAHCLDVRNVQFIPIQLYEGQDSIAAEAVTYHYDELITNIQKAKDISKNLGIHVTFPSDMDSLNVQGKIDPSIRKKVIIPVRERTFHEQETCNFQEIIDSPTDKHQPPGSPEITLKVENSGALTDYVMVLPRAAALSLNYIGERTVSKIRDTARHFRGGLKDPEHPEEIFYCESLFNRVYVLSEEYIIPSNAGDVVPCCIPGRPVLGNIFEKDLIDIWNGEEYRKFRRRFQSSSPPDCCERCVFRRKITKRQLEVEI
jgi:MoaA/NifB/PqqE/SkfB family radical SAM enzyme